MPSIRAKISHRIFKRMWSSNKPITHESVIATRNKIPSFGSFVRTPQPVRKTSQDIGDIPVDVITPQKSGTSNIIVYLHGGGFVYGMTAGHYELVNRLVVATKAKAYVVHYSLAPEHPFPAQINEVEKIYRWLLKQSYKPEHIFFVGDSAGGNIAIAAAILLRDKKISLPKGIIAISPVLDGTYSYPSFSDNESTDFVLSRQKLHFFRDAYLGGELPTNPLASPSLANLKGLPQIQLFVGDKEILFDDAVIFSKKLKQAGVPCELHVGESLMHVYPLATWLFPEAKKSIGLMAKFMSS